MNLKDKRAEKFTPHERTRQEMKRTRDDRRLRRQKKAAMKLLRRALRTLAAK